MEGASNQVYLSLDEIIRLNKEKNIRSGSVKSYGSNKSNKSNYSNRSYGGMSHASNRSFGNMSNCSHRSRGSRGRGGYQNNYNGRHFNRGSKPFRNSGKEPNPFYQNHYNHQNYRALNRGKPNSWYNGRKMPNIVVTNFAKNRVKHAIKVVNKTTNQKEHRYVPYRPMKRQIGKKSDPISIMVKNESANHSFKALPFQRVAHFDHTSVSPLKRFDGGMSSYSNRSNYRNKWGPRLDPQVQLAISQHVNSANFVSTTISETELNNFKAPVCETSLTLHERFSSYLE